MEKISPSFNLYSHPDRLLENHLIGVANLTELFFKDKLLPDQEILKKVTGIIALSHDLGKSTTFFQDYLKSAENEKEKLKKLKETHHGLFSSVCGYYLVKGFLPKDNNKDSFYPLFAFEVVRRHHGNLQDLRDEVIFDENDKEILIKQLENIKEENFNILAQRLFETGLPIRLTKEIIFQWINEFSKELWSYKKTFRQESGDISNYILLNFCYSILLDADKSDVVIRDSNVFLRNQTNTNNWVDNYKAKASFPISPLNDLREKAYREVINKNIDLSNKIYSLNLPTGFGKTLTVFSFALKLREKIKTSNGVTPRIIYALPFLSIIEQNSDILEDIIETNGINPNTNLFLKHHHFSEIFYKKDDNEFESNEAKILIEGWNSEIIITTFIQVFHTLISNSNRNIRKFHRFANSILILDEIQSIPVKYWLLLKHILTELSKRLNTYVIFVTATEPLIFERGEISALIDRENRNFYFNTLSRVTIKPLLKEMTVPELAEYFNLNNGKTYLFILNTISSAKELYQLIKVKGFTSTYLSTNIVPKERSNRIKDIKEKKYKIVVSTQLVEAGVDIDFDIVVRDIAPFDSINQSSGRCNRNGNNKGEVYIVLLKDEKRRYASYIYDSVLLDITEKILVNKNEIKESDFVELIENYYNETVSKKTQDISREFLDAITKLRYDSVDNEISISNFKLIEENYIKKDIFIELDKESEQIWKQYENLKDIKDLFLRKQCFDSIKAKFYQYVISVSANIENLPPMFGEIGYVNSSILKDYYDFDTGFITKDTRTMLIW